MKSKNLRFKAILLLVIALVSTNIKATIYFYKGVGNVLVGASWGVNSDGSGASPANVIGSGHVWHFTNGAGAVLVGGNFGNTGSSIIIEPGFNLTVSLAALHNINGPVSIASGGTVTINVNKNINFSSLDPNSTVVYNSSAKLVQGGGIDYGNIVIAASTSIAPSDFFSVTGSLIINSGVTLTMNSGGIVLYGSISGAGTLRGDSNAFISCSGGNGGNNGTLNFASGFQTLAFLELVYPTNTDYISLGTNLSIASGGYFHQNDVPYGTAGCLNLNGNTLTIENGASAEFANSSAIGSIMSNANSGLIIEGDVGLNFGNPDIYMHSSNNTIGILRVNYTTTLGAGNALNVNNTLDITGGATFNTNNNVTLLSTSTQKGRLADISNGTLNGNLTVRTFALGGTTDWAVLGVSGISGQTLANWEGQIPMTCNSCPNGTTSTSTPFASAVIWDESAAASSSVAYVTMNYTDPLTPGTGFWIFLGTGLTTTSDMTWDVTGVPVMGNISIPMTNNGAANGDGYNLISNPYPSPISWALLHNGNSNVDDAIYIYNADLGLTTSYVASVQSNPGVGANDIIPMGQGFYARATSNTALNATESIKVASSNQLLRPSNTSISSVGSVVHLHVNGGGYSDATAIRFHSNATPNFDKELDAFKQYCSPGYEGYPGVWTKRTVIGTQMNNTDYSINSLPYAHTQNAVIPVVVRVYATGQYTISASDLQNIPPSACVTLFDKVTNTSHNLRTSSYVCNISDTTYAARFELTVCQDITADVKSQSGSVSVNSVIINKDEMGVFVNFDYDKTTEASISVTNILGQKLMDTKKVKTSNGKVYLDLNTNDQLIFVTVETENEKITRKFLNIK